MGPFPSSLGNSYILIAVDYVSKWVEAIASPTNDANVVLKLIKKVIFSRFGVPRAIISDMGSHLAIVSSPTCYVWGASHMGLSYHPQSSSQAEISIRGQTYFEEDGESISQGLNI